MKIYAIAFEMWNDNTGIVFNGGIILKIYNLSCELISLKLMGGIVSNFKRLWSRPFYNFVIFSNNKYCLVLELLKKLFLLLLVRKNKIVVLKI